MKSASLLSAAMALSLLGSVSSARAATITGTAPVAAAGDMVNLNANSAAFAVYPSNAAPVTDVGNAANFSSAIGSVAGVSTDSQIHLTYTGDRGTTPVSATSQTSFIDTNTTFSITLTLQAPSETLDFYLGGYQASTMITATLAGTDITGAVPTYTENSLLPSPNGNNRYGELTLQVAGAQVGDVLTFTETDASGTGNTGLQAIVVEAVPEPSTYAMMLAGFGALAFGLRMRRWSL